MDAVSDSRLGLRSQHPRYRLRKAMFAVVAVVRLRLLAAKWRHHGYPQSRVLVRQHPLYRPGKGRRFLDDFSHLSSQRDGVASTVFTQGARHGTTTGSRGNEEIIRHGEDPMVLQPPERESRNVSSSSATSLTIDSHRPSDSLFHASQSAPILSSDAGRPDRWQQQQRSQPVVRSDPALEAYIRRLDDLRARISSRTKGKLPDNGKLVWFFIVPVLLQGVAVSIDPVDDENTSYFICKFCGLSVCMPSCK